MLKLFSSALLIIVFSIINLSSALSQEKPDELYQVETRDGNIYIGSIISKDSLAIEFKTKSVGTITIKNDFIEVITPVLTNNSGVSKRESFQDTRYFWAPNGYGLKKKEGYYQNVWVFFNQASVGLNNYFSIGAGTMPLFLISGSPTPLWMVPKFSIPVVPDKLNLGAGALIGVVAGESNSTFGITYGVATFGNRDANITFGAGLAFFNNEWAKNPTYNLNGMIRLSQKGYFISENYVIQTGDETLSLISFGGRTVWPKISLDYGLVFPISESMGEFLAIPWLGIMLPFGS